MVLFFSSSFVPYFASFSGLSFLLLSLRYSLTFIYIHVPDTNIDYIEISLPLPLTNTKLWFRLVASRMSCDVRASKPCSTLCVGAC